MDLRRADLLLAAIARGDAIGLTAEGTTPAAARLLLQRHRDRGWPRVAVGNDDHGAGRTGRVTAQARAVHRAFLLAGGRFDGATFARELRTFGHSTVRSLEPAMHKALADLDAGAPWWRGGERAFAEAASGRDAAAASCEVVARAVPIAALAADDASALAAAQLQAIVTDWTPACAHAAAAMVMLLRATMRGERPWANAGPAIATASPAGAEPPELAAWRAATADPRGDDRAGPWLAVHRAADALRIAAGLPPIDPDLAALARELPECSDADAFALVAVLGGRAATNTACAAALGAARDAGQ